MTDSNDSTRITSPLFEEQITPDGRRIFKATASGDNELAGLLDWIAGKDNNEYRYGYRDTWEITIAEGYSPTISKRIDHIRCNITIKGSDSKSDKGEDSKSKIYFTCGVIASQGDDAVMCFTGEDFDHRISVKLINLEFMTVGLTPGIEASKECNFSDYTNFIKNWYAKEVVVYNCDSTLSNGKISNLDIRVADDITIDKCHFINENGLFLVSDEHIPGKSKPNDYGCIIQIRGQVNNVRISNNKFEKYGNDEALAFFGNSIMFDKYADKTPEWKQNYIPRRNVEVTNNTFTYRYPKYNTRPDSYAQCDVLITFNGDDKGNLQNYLQNVDFSFNTIECKLPVRRVIGFGNLECAKKNLNVKVHDNTITHFYDCGTLGIAEVGMVVDFSFTYSNISKGLASSEPVEIFNNTVIAAEKLYESTHGHINVDLQGGSVLVKNNNFDSSGFAWNGPQTGQHSGRPKGSLVMQVKDTESRMVFSGNTCTGVCMLGRIEMSNLVSNRVCDSVGEEAYSVGFKADIELTDNYVEGASKFFFQLKDQTAEAAPTEVNLRLERNFFRTTSYELLAQQFSPAGSLWASLNVWDTRIEPSATQTTGPYYCTVFANYSGQAINLDRVTFISNVICGERVIETIDLPPADAAIIAGNQLNISSDVKE